VFDRAIPVSTPAVLTKGNRRVVWQRLQVVRLSAGGVGVVKSGTSDVVLRATWGATVTTAVIGPAGLTEKFAAALGVTVMGTDSSWMVLSVAITS